MAKVNSDATNEKRKRSPSKSLETQLAEWELKVAGTKKTLEKQEERVKDIKKRIADKKRAEEAKKNQEAAKELTKIVNDSGLSLEELADLAKANAKK